MRRQRTGLRLKGRAVLHNFRLPAQFPNCFALAKRVQSNSFTETINQFCCRNSVPFPEQDPAVGDGVGAADRPAGFLIIFATMPEEILS